MIVCDFTIFQVTPLMGMAVDDTSVAAYKEDLKKEMRRIVPDMRKVSDALKQTFGARRAWLTEAGPTTAEVLEEYPALALADMVQTSFSIITSCFSVLLLVTSLVEQY